MQSTTQNRKTHQEIGNLLIYCSVLSVVNLISDLIALSFYLLLCFVFRFGVLWVLALACLSLSFVICCCVFFFVSCVLLIVFSRLSLCFVNCCVVLFAVEFWYLLLWFVSCCIFLFAVVFFNLPLCVVVLLLHVKCCVVLFRVVFCDLQLFFIICRYDLQFRPAVWRWPLSISFLKTRICIKGI